METFWAIFWSLWGLFVLIALLTTERPKTARDMIEERFPEMQFFLYG